VNGHLGGTPFESHLHGDALSAGTSNCAHVTGIAKLVKEVEGTQFGVLVIGYSVSRGNNC
jgi:hypothetical protein